MIRILTFILCMLPFAVSANVMTFVDLPVVDGSITPYSEDGILAEPRGGYLGASGSPQVAHMDTDGTGFANSIDFSMAERFNAISFDYDPLGWGNIFYLGDGSDPFVVPYLNVELVGERDGSVVATSIFQMNDEDTLYQFGTAFENIEKLTISLLFPSREVVGDGNYECFDPCSHWNIDNVTLSAVPLPVALPLSGAALIGLGLFRKYKKKTS